MCERAVLEGLNKMLQFVPDRLKTRDMFERYVEEDPRLLKHVRYQHGPKRCVTKVLKDTWVTDV